MKTHATHLLVTVVGLLLLQGCATTTQTLNLTPYFDGRLKHEGTPLTDTRILLSIKQGDSQCEHPASTTTTGSQGEFSIRPISKQQSYVPFVNYSYTEWNLCAEYQQQRYLLQQNNRYDDARQPSSLYLECDLSQPTKSRCKSMYYTLHLSLFLTCNSLKWRLC